jgi:hypothetical protein
MELFLDWFMNKLKRKPQQRRWVWQRDTSDGRLNAALALFGVESNLPPARSAGKSSSRKVEPVRR